MEFLVGAASISGRVRQANEDAFLVADGIVAVADGMGGHRAGEVASAETVDTLRAVVGMRAPADIAGAVHLANRRVHDQAAENDELHGMGTTVCVLAEVDDDGGTRLVVLNVGDSRIYHFGEGVLTQLTEDHSLVEVLVRDGRLTPEEAEVHPQRNVLTRALGVEAVVEVDSWLLTPADGDRFLLCSDGLFNELSSDRIAEVMTSAADPDVAARLLTERADTAGGRDNITVVVVDVAETGAPSAPLEGRLRRVTLPPVDLTDLERDAAAAEGADDEPTSTHPIVEAMAVETADGSPPARTNPPALSAPTADSVPSTAPPSRWSPRWFVAAVVVVVVIGVAAIVLGVLGGSSGPAPTTSTSTSTVATSTTDATSVPPAPTVSATTPPPAGP
ncbi:MAG: protein phosphatase 2C domain-containing protein [Actinomycetes bacterium]